MAKANQRKPRHHGGEIAAKETRHRPRSMSENNRIWRERGIAEKWRSQKIAPDQRDDHLARNEIARSLSIAAKSMS